MPFMSGDTIILSSLFVLYKENIKDELDKFIVTTHYCLMKQGFTVLDAIEGSVGIFFAFYFIYFSFRKGF